MKGDTHQDVTSTLRALGLVRRAMGANDEAADSGGGGVDVDEQGPLLVDGRLGCALKTGPTSGRNLGH